MWLIGSLYIHRVLREAGGVAGQGAARGRSEGAWQREPGEGGMGAGQGLGVSPNASARGSVNLRFS